MKKWNIKAKVIVEYEKEINATTKNDAIKQFEELIYEDLKEKNIPFIRGDIHFDEKSISMREE